MTGIHSPDRTSVPPSSADMRVTTASERSPQTEGAVVTSISLPALQAVAPAPAAASSGVAAFSAAAHAVLAGIALGVCLRASINNVTAFATAAANEIVSNSTSSVEA